MNSKLSFTLILILLVLLGSFVVFSVAPHKIVSHLLFLLLGFGLYFYFSRQPTAVFSNLGPYFYLFSLLLLVLTLVLGKNIRGATRWLVIGSFRFQSSELVKPLLIASYANFMTKWKPVNLKNILINALLAGLPIFLIFLQPDLGTALIHIFIWFTMLFLAGIPTLYLLLSFGLAGLAFSLSPYLLKPYQLERLLTFINPERDPLGAGYNVIQATITIGSGRLFGRGLGGNTQTKLHFLPERHTDFIFASLAEELGFLGVSFLFGLLYLLFTALLKFLFHQPNFTHKLILGGVFAYLFIQSILNVAMNLGIAPVTGVTLPLISYGGSSLLAIFMALGMAVSTLNTLHSKPELEIK